MSGGASSLELVVLAVAGRSENVSSQAPLESPIWRMQVTKQTTPSYPVIRGSRACPACNVWFNEVPLHLETADIVRGIKASQSGGLVATLCGSAKRTGCYSELVNSTITLRLDDRGLTTVVEQYLQQATQSSASGRHGGAHVVVFDLGNSGLAYSQQFWEKVVGQGVNHEDLKLELYLVSNAHMVAQAWQPYKDKVSDGEKKFDTAHSAFWKYMAVGIIFAPLGGICFGGSCWGDRVEARRDDWHQAGLDCWLFFTCYQVSWPDDVVLSIVNVV